MRMMHEHEHEYVARRIGERYRLAGYLFDAGLVALVVAAMFV
jgi:hypothetical protein